MSKKARVDRIGPFEIRHEIGRGSFATVFAGSKVTSDPPLPVAIKAVVRNKLTPKLLDNLESEIRLLKGISHRNVVALLDCLKTEHHIYLIMGFCSGGDLSGYIKKRGQVEGLDESLHGDRGRQLGPSGRPPPLYPHPKEGGLNEVIVRSFLGQLSDALKFLRGQNIIHRDIKPQNLLLQSYSEYAATAHPENIRTIFHPPTIPILQVADFGFARFLPQASMAETLCGSPLYMAPEILRYERYDAKADLWSVGAVLYEMSVGKPPFRAQNHVELLRRIEKGEDRIKFPDERSTPGLEIPEVEADLKFLIRGLLKRNPAERMSFEDFFTSSELVAVSGASAHLHQPSPAPSEEVKEENKPLIQKQPPQLITRKSSFAPKYVTGSPSPSSTPPLQQQDFSQPVNIPPPNPATLNEGAFVAVNTLPRRKSAATPDLIVASSAEDESPVRPATPRSASMMQGKPAVADEDSVLGTEYVVVEKRTVEVNALADELATNNQRPSVIARRSSRGFLSRPLSALQASPPLPPTQMASSPIPYPPVPASDDLASTPPFALAAHQRSAGLGTSPRSRPSIIPYSSSPRNNSYGLLPFAGLSANPGPTILKAINLASLKLFGNPADGILLRRPSARRKGLPRFDRVADAQEIQLVAELEDLGQKASVIFDFADSKLLQMLPPAASSGSISPSHPGISSSPFNPTPPLRRTSSSSLERPLGLKQDVMAAEALLLYIRALAFLQRGIEKARVYWDNRSSPAYEASPEFNEAVQWLRIRFNECYEKAEFTKARTQDEIPDSAVFTEKLIFDRALEMSRAAAVNELMGDNTADCEVAYETALYMLYGIVDENLADSASVKEEDRTTVNKFIKSIQGRLAALRKKTSVQQA